MKRITLKQWLIDTYSTDKITSVTLQDHQILYAYDVKGERKRVKKITRVDVPDTGRKYKMEFVDWSVGWRKDFEYVVINAPTERLDLDKFDVPKDNGFFDTRPFDLTQTVSYEDYDETS